MSTDNLTGTLSSTGNLNGTFGTSGGGGTSNYNELVNKPQINGNTLEGNKTTEQLGINIPDMSNYYNKTETDTLLDGKADTSDLPDMSNYYNKTETDTLLDGKADTSDLPDMSNYYNKSETDTLLDGKVNNSSFNAASLPITSGSATNTKDYIDSGLPTTTMGTVSQDTNTTILRSSLVKYGNVKTLSIIFQLNNSSATAIGTLPSGYAPQNNIDFNVVSDNGAILRLRIQSNSTTISISNGYGSTTGTYFSFAIAFI